MDAGQAMLQRAEEGRGARNIETTCLSQAADSKSIGLFTNYLLLGHVSLSVDAWVILCCGLLACGGGPRYLQRHLQI